MWVPIPAPDAGWTFVKLQYLIEKAEINEKEAGTGPFFKLSIGIKGQNFSIGTKQFKINWELPEENDQ